MSLITQYKESLKPKGTEEPLDLLFYRPFGFLIAFLTQRTCVKPNHFTYLSLLFGILSGVFLFYEHPILGFVCFHICVVFDCVDGQLARLTQNYSLYGRALDGIVDYIAFVFFYNGVALYYHFGHPEISIFLIYGILIFIGIVVLVQATSIDYYRNMYFHQLKNEDIQEELKEVNTFIQRESFFNLKRWVMESYKRYLLNQIRLLEKTKQKVVTLTQLSRRIFFGLSTNVFILSILLLFNDIPYYLVWIFFIVIYLMILKFFKL